MIASISIAIVVKTDTQLASSHSRLCRRWKRNWRMKLWHWSSVALYTREADATGPVPWPSELRHLPLFTEKGDVQLAAISATHLDEQVCF